MTWPSSYKLPFINFETVWRVYELSDDSQNPTRTLKAIVCYKNSSGSTYLEYMGFPSNVAEVTFESSTDILEFERDTSFTGTVPLTGSNSLNSACVSAFGPQFKRFKATVTSTYLSNPSPPWLKLTTKGSAPQFDPGGWCIVDSSGDTLAGTVNEWVSGPSVPTSGNNRVVTEYLRVAHGGTRRTPDKFRAYHIATSTVDPTTYDEYIDNLDQSKHGQSADWLFDPMTITSTWN